MKRYSFRTGMGAHQTAGLIEEYYKNVRKNDVRNMEVFLEMKTGTYVTFCVQ